MLAVAAPAQTCGPLPPSPPPPAGLMTVQQQEWLAQAMDRQMRIGVAPITDSKLTGELDAVLGRWWSPPPAPRIASPRPAAEWPPSTVPGYNDCLRTKPS